MKKIIVTTGERRSTLDLLGGDAICACHTEEQAERCRSYGAEQVYVHGLPMNGDIASIRHAVEQSLTRPWEVYAMLDDDIVSVTGCTKEPTEFNDLRQDKDLSLVLSEWEEVANKTDSLWIGGIIYDNPRFRMGDRRWARSGLSAHAVVTRRHPLIPWNFHGRYESEDLARCFASRALTLNGLFIDRWTHVKAQMSDGPLGEADNRVGANGMTAWEYYRYNAEPILSRFPGLAGLNDSGLLKMNRVSQSCIDHIQMRGMNGHRMPLL